MHMVCNEYSSSLNCKITDKRVLVTIISVVCVAQWLSGYALGIRTRGPGIDSRVAPQFHWVATLGKLFTHIASAVSQLQETGVQKGVFGA